MNIQEINEKAKIEYPTKWKYKVIFDAGFNAKGAIDAIMNEKPYTLESSKSSGEGKYESYNLETTVENEHERLALFGALKNIAKYVL
ncbi:DUF493 domain-containing protein [Campylobacter sp. 19-13652]|uniref:HP0495 family protein n=1 Tax=Campylobacter sp. 19-13652 TaxID=2840180 RepID=UPI001C74B9DC|nr:DUF493 domain-containing protein [Campylobacter sp. 19-13652]BCX78714.1 hypothetical protein LBC_01760 [Campylobacter sp. 19-13652]